MSPLGSLGSFTAIFEESAVSYSAQLVSIADLALGTHLHFWDLAMAVYFITTMLFYMEAIF